ncbi:hypothetical protein BJ741DRAFT_627754 [Chytriomyces cf. hyalinus JEL632]|nr:hypothetical protein BJ741DRAFT_627754 [Chytriomyces cf. hyalinus JEL632]
MAPIRISHLVALFIVLGTMLAGAAAQFVERECVNELCACGPWHENVVCKKGQHCTLSVVTNKHSCVSRDCALDAQLFGIDATCDCFGAPCGIGSTCDSASRSCVCGYANTAIPRWGSSKLVQGAFGATTAASWHVCNCGGGPPFASMPDSLSGDVFWIAAFRNWTSCQGGGNDVSCSIRSGFTGTALNETVPVCGSINCVPSANSNCLCPPENECIFSEDAQRRLNNGASDSVSVSRPCNCGGVRADIGYSCPVSNTIPTPIPLESIPTCINPNVRIPPNWFCPADTSVAPAPACGSATCSSTNPESCLCSSASTCVSGAIRGLVPSIPFGSNRGVCIPNCAPDSSAAVSCMCNAKNITGPGQYCSKDGKFAAACESPSCSPAALALTQGAFSIDLCGCSSAGKVCATGINGLSPFGKCLSQCPTNILLTEPCSCNSKETPANFICPATGDARPACATPSCLIPVFCSCPNQSDACTPLNGKPADQSMVCLPKCPIDGSVSQETCACSGKSVPAGSLCGPVGGDASAPCNDACQDAATCACPDASNQMCAATHGLLDKPNAAGPKFVCLANCDAKTVGPNGCSCSNNACPSGSLCLNSECLPSCGAGAWNTGTGSCNCHGSPALPGWFCPPENNAAATPECGLVNCNASGSCECLAPNHSCLGAGRGVCVPACGTSTIPAGGDCECGGTTCSAGSLCSNNQCFPRCLVSTAVTNSTSNATTISTTAGVNCNCEGMLVPSICTPRAQPITCGDAACTSPSNCACPDASLVCSLSVLSNGTASSACLPVCSRTTEATSTCSCHGMALSNGFVCPADGSALAPKCGASTCNGPFFSGCKCFASGQFCVDGGADLNGVCANRCTEGAIVAGDNCRCGLSPCPTGSKCTGGKCLAKCASNAFNRATTSCHCADGIVPPGQYCDPSDSVVPSKKEFCACPDLSNTCASIICLPQCMKNGFTVVDCLCNNKKAPIGDAVPACGAPSCSTIADKSKCACSSNSGTCFPSASGSKEDAGECLAVCEPNLETKRRCICNGIPVLANYFCPAAPESARSKRGVLDAIPVCQTPTCPSNAISSCTCETITPGNVCVASRTGRNGQCLPLCSVGEQSQVDACACNGAVMPKNSVCLLGGTAAPVCGTIACPTSAVGNCVCQSHDTACLQPSDRDLNGICVTKCASDNAPLTGSGCSCGGRLCGEGSICKDGLECKPLCGTTQCTNAVACGCSDAKQSCYDDPAGTNKNGICVSPNPCGTSLVAPGSLCACKSELCVAGQICMISPTALATSTDLTCNVPPACGRPGCTNPFECPCPNQGEICVTGGTNVRGTCAATCIPGAPTPLSGCTCETGKLCPQGNMCTLSSQCIPIQNCIVSAALVANPSVGDRTVCACGTAFCGIGQVCNSSGVCGTSVTCGSDSCVAPFGVCGCAMAGQVCISQSGSTHGSCLVECGVGPAKGCSCAGVFCGEGNTCVGAKCFPTSPQCGDPGCLTPFTLCTCTVEGQVCGPGGTNGVCAGPVVKGNTTAIISGSSSSSNPINASPANSTLPTQDTIVAANGTVNGTAITCTDRVVAIGSVCLCGTYTCSAGQLCSNGACRVPTSKCGESSCESPFTSCGCGSTLDMCVSQTGSVNGVCAKSCNGTAPALDTGCACNGVLCGNGSRCVGGLCVPSCGDDACIAPFTQCGCTGLGQSCVAEGTSGTCVSGCSEGLTSNCVCGPSTPGLLIDDTASSNSSMKTAARPLADFCKIGSLCFTGTCLQKCNVGVNTGATPCNCNNHVARPDYYCRDSVTALPIPACGRTECKGPSWECACDQADETCFATVPFQNGTLTHGACYKACPTVEPFSSSECLCNGTKCPTGSVCANGICNYGNTTFLVISQDFNAITKTLSLVLGAIPNDTNHIVSDMKGSSDYPGFSTDFVGTYLVNQGVANQFIFPDIALENCGDTVVVQFMAQICLVDSPQTISSVGSCRPNSPTLQKSFTITATTTSTCAIALVVNSFSVEGMVQDINTGSSVILLADNVWQFVLHSSELQEAGMYIDVLSVSLNDKAASVLMDATCFTLVNAGFGTSTFTTTARVMNNTLTSYKDVAESGARLVCSGPQRGFLLAKKEAGVTYTFSFDLGFGASIPPTSIGGGGSSGTGGTMQSALKRRGVTMSNELPSGSRVALSANVGSTLVRSNSSNPDWGSLNSNKGLSAGQIVGVVAGALVVICVFGLVGYFMVKRLRPAHVEKGAVDVNEMALGGGGFLVAREAKDAARGERGMESGDFVSVRAIGKVAVL